MKIAVLGANGFIGSYLCTYLQTRYHDVLPVTRHTVDLRNFVAVDEWLKVCKPDVIVNAAVSGGGLRVAERNYQDLENNLAIFFNFYNSPRSFRFINIGSGAEFDKAKNLDGVLESDLIYHYPQDAYGLSKNIISRCVLQKQQFMTLRLFGCFDNREPEFRLFKRFLSGQVTNIQNRYFDYFSLCDFSKVVEFFCRTDTVSHQDINCVYHEKYTLSEILTKLKEYRNLDIPIFTDGETHPNYTGSSKILDYYIQCTEFPKLDGLEKGLQKYD